MDDGDQSADDLLKALREMVRDGQEPAAGPPPLRLGAEARVHATDSAGFASGPPLSEELSAAMPMPGEAALRQAVAAMVRDEIEGRQRGELDNRIRQIVRQELAAMSPDTPELETRQDT